MNQGLFMTFDLSAIWRRVKKNFVYMMMIAITAMMMTYVVYDCFVPPKYGTKVLFAIVSENKNMIANSNRNYVAGKRICTYLTGDTINTALCEQMGIQEEDFTGKLSAEALTGNNLILITCTDRSKEAAFVMAEAVREGIPSILERFMKMYRLKALGQNEAASIQRMSRGTVSVSVLIGLLVFFSELFAVILMQIFSDRLQNREQIEDELEQTLIGVVPHDRHRKKTESMLVDSGLRTLEYIESFQRIASTVDHMCRKSRAKVIMVASCLENEGKSTIAANIALTMARNGKHVMLVDLDFRKPALHRIMEVRDYGDLGEYLRTGRRQENIIMRRGKSLYCSFTKPIKGQPDGILEKNGIRKYLEIVRKGSDYVILDTPPMAITRDAEVLMNLADASILVARQNQAPIPLLDDKIELLEEGNAEFLGLILNDEAGDRIKTDSSSYGYWYRYQK